MADREGHLFKGEATMSLNIDQGSTRQKEADMDVAMEWRHLNHRVKLQSELEYDTTENEKRLTGGSFLANMTT